jgi:hypothetical protein
MNGLTDLNIVIKYDISASKMRKIYIIIRTNG